MMTKKNREKRKKWHVLHILLIIHMEKEKKLKRLIAQS